MADLRGYRRPAAGSQPSYLHPAYRSSVKRAPTQPLVAVPHTLAEITGPLFEASAVQPADCDHTKQHDGTPLGERIVVAGRVLDEDARPVPRTLIEVWQANAAGRYRHPGDQHDAPLDPNFTGAGRTVTDDEGRYGFMTVKPGAYPWRNHPNAWRPAHIHFSLFGPGFVTRLVTQMYFPGDPLLPLDPIFNCVTDLGARDRMVAAFELDSSMPEFALAYRFDLVLRGRSATPFEA